MFASTFTAFDPSLSPTQWPLMIFLPMLLMMFGLPSYWVTVKSYTYSMMSGNMIPMAILRSNKNNPLKGEYASSFRSNIYLIFILVGALNMWGIYPYIFSATSHLLITMSLGLPSWLAIIIMSKKSIPMKVPMAKLMPEGAPTMLGPFLATVEVLSTLVRPITLSFRLAANLSAGHVILGMMSALTSFLLNYQMMSTGMALLLISAAYFSFEMMISMIQAYVFCVLLSMYTSDYL